MTVIVCSHNGAHGLPATLAALNRQTIRQHLEIVVVDDGSTDQTAAVAAAAGVRVVRHETNRGLAAARNTGLSAALTEMVAFTDDDCEPASAWTERLYQAAQRNPGAVAFGAAIVPTAADGLIQKYLRVNNPLVPLESSLLSAHGVARRFYQYLRRAAAVDRLEGERAVASVAGAGMAMRRSVVLAEGGFDERFRFGAEEEDLFRRLHRSGHRVVFVPDALVRHRFAGTARDMLRRSTAYGRGNARMFLKYPGSVPTLYPAPAVVALAAMTSVVWWPACLLAPAVPQVLFSRWARLAWAERDPVLLTFPYLQLAQEAASNVGWLSAWHAERRAFRGGTLGAQDEVPT